MPRMDTEQNTPAPSQDADAAPAEQQPAEQPAASKPKPNPIKVVLASASPRRRQLLHDAGVSFIVRPSDIDEQLDRDAADTLEEAAQKLAEQKAGAVVQELLAEDTRGWYMVIGADTIVVCDEEVFGKPRNLDDAKRMLRRLSGRTHQVMTSVSVWMLMVRNEQDVSVGYHNFTETTDVVFRELTDEEIADYLRKGESFDKAGAYAIQGAGADLVDHIDGALDNVIGLPVERLFKEFPYLRPA